MRYFGICQPERVAVARRLAKDLVEEQGLETVFIGGSPFAGLGTSCSDIDVFVVTRAEDSEPNTTNSFVGVERIDLETWPLALLTDAAEVATAFSVPEDDLTMIQRADRYRMRVLIRLAYGEIVTDVHGCLAGLREKFLSNYPEVVKFLTFSACVATSNKVEDAAGFVDAKEFSGAVYSARLAVLQAAEAKLAALGDPYEGLKWVWAKWARSSDGSTGLDLAHWLDRAPVDRDGALGLLWISQDLLLQPIGESSYPIIPTPTSGMPVRNPWLSPMLTSTAVLIYRPGAKAVRISPQGALLLGVAHGHSREEAVGMCADRLVASGVRVDPAEIDKYYQSLVDAKLIGQAESFQTSRR